MLGETDLMSVCSHTASTAAGNLGVNVKVNSSSCRKARGMAPRGGLAIYRALFGDRNTEADAIATIDQAIQDRVDVLSLSLKILHLAETRGLFSVFDIALFHARSVGIIVIQAAGNSGSFPAATVSVSPWIPSVGSTDTSRKNYSNLVLGDRSSILGLGMSGPTKGRLATMVWSKDAHISREQDGLLECQKPSAFNRTVGQDKLIVCVVNVMNVEHYSIQETARGVAAKGLMVAATHDAYQYLTAEPVTHSFPTGELWAAWSSTSAILVTSLSCNPSHCSESVQTCSGNGRQVEVGEVFVLLLASVTSRSPHLGE